ncbi:hypothetical protein [Streptomyces sp. ODS28]|uniref:hypothetical protein n=1 Tax=Streptomyces sp. ODS28 TaxID=3136688 RepID=UPI0031E9A03F
MSSSNQAHRRTRARSWLRRAAVVLTGTGVAVGIAVAPATAAGGWQPVPDPNSNNWMDAFLPAADGTVFARGGYFPQGDPGSGEFSTYWQREGTAWKQIPLPRKTQSLDTYGDDRWTATSAKDLWVIGSMAATPTIANHWNGTAWEDRSPADKTVAFNSVKALSAKEVWAAGETQWTTTTPTQAGVIGRWDGTDWKITKLPQAKGGRTLLGNIHAVSSTDVWASGETCEGQDTSRCRGIVMRWNGSSWKEVPLPAGTGGVSEITANASGEVWAAAGTKVLRWTGSSWDTSAEVKLPKVYGVTELTWAGGKLYAGLSLEQRSGHSGVLRWNGRSWDTIASPFDPKTDYEDISSVSSLSGAPDGSLWAAGSYRAFFATPTFASYLPASAIG